VRLFELGTTFTRGKEGAPPKEVPHLALVLHGLRAPGHWTGEASFWDLWDLKGLLFRIAHGIWGDGVVVRPGSRPGVLEVLDPSGNVAGEGGALAPGSLDLPPWAQTVWGAELALPEQPSPPAAVRYRPIPRHPGVDRDLALLLPSGTWAQGVVDGIRGSAGPLLVGVDIFDQYQGKGLPDGVRSVGFRLRFQADERTLTESEVEHAVADVLRTLEADGVRLRGS
jgi:phenylalanyl-tRNA synthetase beta chain